MKKREEAAGKGQLKKFRKEVKRRKSLSVHHHLDDGTPAMRDLNGGGGGSAASSERGDPDYLDSPPATPATPHHASSQQASARISNFL